jgi:hypothetical protein
MARCCFALQLPPLEAGMSLLGQAGTMRGGSRKRFQCVEIRWALSFRATAACSKWMSRRLGGAVRG